MLRDTTIAETAPVEIVARDEVRERVAFAELATLHELLAFALHDFEKVLEDRRYRIDMAVWHMPSRSGKTCNVCLAGSVMAKSLAADRQVEQAPCFYADAERRRLAALNMLRVGDIASAVQALGKPMSVRTAGLRKKWGRELGWCNTITGATNRQAGRRLLGKLRALQRDLQAVGM